MSITIEIKMLGSGFKYQKIYGTDSVQLRVDNGIDAAAEREILKGDYHSLWLYSGNFERMFEVVENELNIKRVKVQSTEMQDVSWVSALKSLEYLGLRGRVKGDIDCSRLKKLKTAELEYSRLTKGLLASNCELESLSISKLSDPLTSFGKTLRSTLTVLGITGPLKSLEGIAYFKNLDSLSLMDMRNLADVSELEVMKYLKTLDITACNKVNLDRVLPKLTSLERFVYENKVLSSLKLIPKDNLKTIVLGEQTVIEDRDVECSLQFPKLEKFIFYKKKGYKYNAEELEKLRKAR